MTDINSQIEAAKTELSDLQSQVEKLLIEKRDATLGSTSLGGLKSSLAPLRGPPATKVRRTLKGHFGKVVDLHWGGDSESVVSASQDGTLLLWNAVTTNKKSAIPLKSHFVMSVGMEQKQGRLVACGGLDNLCTVYRWDRPDAALLEMASHDGYISCCRFLSETKIITSSGDSTLLTWDLETGHVMDTFDEHKADVMRLSLSPTDPNVVVSGSVDKTAKVWDVRTPRNGSVQTFVGHRADIDGVEFMPNGMAFGTASEDGTARIFDLRAYNEVARFGTLVVDEGSTGGKGLTCLSFGRSGRILFAGHADASVLAWDVMKASTTAPAFTLNQAHESHVSCIGINPKGDALCTGSWDTTLKIWA